MNITQKAALLWAKRLYKALNAPETKHLSETLSGSQTLLAKAAGCAHWHEFQTYLTTPDHVGVNVPATLTHSFAQYDRRDVELAILQSFSGSTQDGNWANWANQALNLLYLIFAIAPEPFHSIDEIRDAITLEYLVQHRDKPEIDNYLSHLPGSDWANPKKAGDIGQVDLDAWKPNKSYFGFVQDVAHHYLDAWDRLLDGGAANRRAAPPMTFDLLMRCTEQRIKWPKEWQDWFHSTRGLVSNN